MPRKLHIGPCPIQTWIPIRCMGSAGHDGDCYFISGGYKTYLTRIHSVKL